jgi:type VI secretion system VasD/TssJ family lipoprotein
MSALQPLYKNSRWGIVTVLLALCVFACASKPSAEDSGLRTEKQNTQHAALSTQHSHAGPMTEGKAPARVFWPKGIQIQYTSAVNLNLYENRAHTILLVVYQLNGLNAYNSFIKTPDGLSRLMQADRFDASVVGVDQFFVEPNEKKTLFLDRAENVQYIAVVAGYYDMQPGQVNRLFEIPVIADSKGIYGFRTTVSGIGQLNISLFMGPNSIHEVSAQ